MYVQVSKSFFKWGASLNHRTWVVLSALLFHMNYKTGLAYPSYTKLKEFTKLSDKTIWAALKELEVLQIIKYWKAPTKGKQYAHNVYKIKVWDGHKIHAPKRLDKQDISKIIKEFYA